MVGRATRTLPRAFLAWVLFVGVCGLVEQRCAHTDYDYRASKHFGCTKLKQQMQQTQQQTQNSRQIASRRRRPAWMR